MGVAVDLLDAVVDKLNETTFGSAVVERQIIPDITKKSLQPSIMVALQGKESHELDRTNEALKYTVAVGLSYPISADSEADKAAALSMSEDIMDWLASRANQRLTVTGGECRLLQPIVMEAVVDPTVAREAGIFFTHSNFIYRFYKDRS